MYISFSLCAATDTVRQDKMRLNSSVTIILKNGVWAQPDCLCLSVYCI